MPRSKCSQCQKTIKYKEASAGKKVKCPNCGNAFRLPVPAQTPITSTSTVENVNEHESGTATDILDDMLLDHIETEKLVGNLAVARNRRSNRFVLVPVPFEDAAGNRRQLAIIFYQELDAKSNVVGVVGGGGSEILLLDGQRIVAKGGRFTGADIELSIDGIGGKYTAQVNGQKFKTTVEENEGNLIASVNETRYKARTLDLAAIRRLPVGPKNEMLSDRALFFELSKRPYLGIVPSVNVSLSNSMAVAAIVVAALGGLAIGGFVTFALYANLMGGDWDKLSGPQLLAMCGAIAGIGGLYPALNTAAHVLNVSLRLFGREEPMGDESNWWDRFHSDRSRWRSAMKNKILREAGALKFMKMRRKIPQKLQLKAGGSYLGVALFGFGALMTYGEVFLGKDDGGWVMAASAVLALFGTIACFGLGRHFYDEGLNWLCSQYLAGALDD